MKKIFLIGCLVLISFSSMGEIITMDGVVYNQETFEPFNGVIETFHINSPQKIRSVVNYKNGLSHGSTQWFFENGDLQQNETFVDGKRDGYSVIYFEDGRKSIHGNYVNGLKEGTWEKSFESPWVLNPNPLEYRERYKNGKLDGLQESFYDVGGPRLRQLYLWGKKEGLSEEFFPVVLSSGVSQLESVGNYKNDVKEGLWKEYYSDGQLKDKRNYKNGKTEGLVLVFHPNGQLSWRENYKNGKLDGLQEVFHLNGDRLMVGCYKNSKSVGMSYCEEE